MDVNEQTRHKWLGEETYTPLSYNITGESAPIFFESKKCRQKHGGLQLVPPAQGIYH